MAGNGQLAHIFIDEAHVLVTERSFRHSMVLQLAGVFGYNCPKALLSATIPPTLETDIARSIGRTDSRELMIVRGRTYRPNIKYIVDSIPQYSEAASIKKLLRLYASDNSSRAIIYTPTRKLTKEIAGKIGVPFYHGGDMDADKIQ
ncbi:hypothetical protein LPJ61_007029, partial [Coemansia biformis]